MTLVTGSDRLTYGTVLPMSIGIKAPGYSRVFTECQEDPELFMSNLPSDKDKAAGICGRCPVKDRCLRQAEEEPTTYGTWGGKFFTLDDTKANQTLCRKGLHVLPDDRENNLCIECRRVRDKEYKKTAKGKEIATKAVKKRKEKKRNHIGGTCYSGLHVLTEANTKRRSFDNALMCIDCLQSLAKIRFKTDTGTRENGRPDRSVWAP